VRVYIKTLLWLQCHNLHLTLCIQGNHNIITPQSAKFNISVPLQWTSNLNVRHPILGKFLGVGCHFLPPPLDIRCLHVQQCERPPAVESGTTLCGWEMFRQISPRMRIPHNSKDLLHAANLWHGRDSFTSPLKEGVLRIFLPLKIWRLWPGLNLRTWVPKASTLPLDHRSHSYYVYFNILYCIIFFSHVISGMHTSKKDISMNQKTWFHFPHTLLFKNSSSI
jgi:hypothetical protein